jgi:hypothetical protein
MSNRLGNDNYNRPKKTLQDKFTKEEIAEKLIGYKLDGRKIGKTKPTKSTKLPLIMKIIKTVLSIFATLLDLILLVLTNQTDIFANMVKNMLGK